MIIKRMIFSCSLNVKITMQQVHDIKHQEYINNESNRTEVKGQYVGEDTFKTND